MNVFRAQGNDRAVVWEEHPNGTVSATWFLYRDADGGVEVDSQGIWAMALRKGYRTPVPDLLLRELAEAVQIGGAPFRNVSELLTLCEIPLDVERLPMRREQGASTSP